MDHTNAAGVPLDLQHPANRRAVEGALPAYLSTRRWFGGKARPIREIRITDSLATGQSDTHRAHMAIVEVVFADGDSQQYVVPAKIDLLPDSGESQPGPAGEIARWQVDAGPVRRTLVASDATFDSDFAAGLLDAVMHARRWSGDNGDIVAWGTLALPDIVSPSSDLAPAVMGAEQSNTSIRYGNALILKLFRRLEEGTSPELEIGRVLEAAQFRETPPLGGAIEYARPGHEPLTLAVLQGYVANRGDAWGYTLESLGDYYERALSQEAADYLATVPFADLLDLSGQEVPPAFADLAGGYMKSAATLGRTTAHMHLALARAGADPAFASEPLGLEDLEQMYAGMRLLTDQAFGLLESNRGSLPADAIDEANAVLSASGDIESRFGPLMSVEGGGMRTRVHGDYHLGQVLYTGADFYIIDFEGEPARSLAERRRKYSPLKDVAGMIRSFHYAAYSGLFNYGRKRATAVAGDAGSERWADAWYNWSSATFLRHYLETISGSDLLPGDSSSVRVLLSTHLLEKAVYELVYELNNRPTWVAIPLKGISALLS